MTFHSCNCHYLPSHVLGKIDKRGDDKVRVAARGSEQQAKFRRGRCNERALKISEFLTGLVAGAKLAGHRHRRARGLRL
jgi:hypothetical protein